MIENVRQLLGLKVVLRFGEPGDIRKADRKLLSFRRDFDILLASKNGLIDLGRKIL